MLDDAVAYRARDSRSAAERLLIEALASAASLDAFASEVVSFRNGTSRAFASCLFSDIVCCTK